MRFKTVPHLRFKIVLHLRYKIGLHLEFKIIPQFRFKIVPHLKSKIVHTLGIPNSFILEIQKGSTLEIQKDFKQKWFLTHFMLLIFLTFETPHLIFKTTLYKSVFNPFHATVLTPENMTPHVRFKRLHT